MSSDVYLSAAPEVIARFWAHVNRSGPSDCWLWLGSAPRGTYGQIYAGRRDKRQTTLLVHRLSWVLAHQRAIPKGLHVCHTCDVPRCVNPAHLFIGTPKQNLDDAIRKGRLVYGRGARKLSLADYRLILTTDARGVDLARHLGVSEVSIARIRMGIQGAVLRAQVLAERRPISSPLFEIVAVRQLPVVGEIR